MSLVYSVFVPHPPIVVPEIGKGEEQVCQKTLSSFQTIAKRFKDYEVERALIISPHAQLMRNGLTMLRGQTLYGDFGRFGVPALQLSVDNDLELGELLKQSLPNLYPIEGNLDHGALVPLYFLHQAGWQGKVAVLSMPLEDPQDYGQRIGQLLKDRPERYALIASGDMSHRLRKDGPYGFHPAGPQFDGLVQKILAQNPALLGSIPEDLAEDAAECGYRSLLCGLAVKKGDVKVLSYEGPFGVGYMVAELYRSSPLPQWARTCLRRHLERRPISESEFPVSGEFTAKRGCFVTLKKQGELRGCIGTTKGWQQDLAHEIHHNAIAAGTEDPRFWPVEIEELADIEFSVDVLGELEAIDSPDMLDPYRYGVVVRKGGRSGLLLPHLEGIDTVEEQIRIAKQKAGIRPNEDVELWRFEVIRHFE